MMALTDAAADNRDPAGHAALVASAEAIARELVAEAGRQRELILEGARAEAERLRVGHSDALDLITRTVDAMDAQALAAIHHTGRALSATDEHSQSFDRRLAKIAGSAPMAPRTPSPRSREQSVERRLPLVSSAPARKALYWAAVLLVSLALVVALILLIESRDTSSLEPARIPWEAAGPF
jgi:hypothetical protein